jgi:hypothetical protein
MIQSTNICGKITHAALTAKICGEILTNEKEIEVICCAQESPCNKSGLLGLDPKLMS